MHKFPYKSKFISKNKYYSPQFYFFSFKNKHSTTHMHKSIDEWRNESIDRWMDVSFNTHQDIYDKVVNKNHIIFPKKVYNFRIRLERKFNEIINVFYFVQQTIYQTSIVNFTTRKNITHKIWRYTLSHRKNLKELLTISPNYYLSEQEI